MDRDKRGFTLVEVMIAIAVVGIGFVGAAMMLSGTISSNAKAMALTGASRAAADQLEILSALDYNDPLLQDDPDGTGLFLGEVGLRNPLPPAGSGLQDRPDPVTYPSDYQITTGGGDYTVYWNVAEDIPMPDSKKVFVVATSTGKGPQKTVAIEYIIRDDF